MSLGRISGKFDIARGLNLGVAILFLSYALSEYSYVNLNGDSLNPMDAQAIRLSALLLFIAGLHYAGLSLGTLTHDAQMMIRYSDWFFTTPLILLSLANFLRVDDCQVKTLIVFLNIIMIVTGFLHEIGGPLGWWVAGFVALVGIYFFLYPQFVEQGHKDLFMRFLVWGWIPYGLLALVPRSNRAFLYGVLDVYNKLVLASVVRKFIHLRTA